MVIFWNKSTYIYIYIHHIYSYKLREIEPLVFGRRESCSAVLKVFFLPGAFDGRFAECFWMATHPACAQKTSTPTPTLLVLWTTCPSISF